jgi:prepilin-type N-terminal cleavage/methylation domain-containing protein
MVGNIINLLLNKKDHSFSGTTLTGFTLIELLIVISVIGALAAVSLVSIGPANAKRARDTIRRSDIKQYQTALEVYANKNNGSYPPGSGNLTGKCGDLGLTGGLCKGDPGSGTYQYATTGTTYVVWATLEYKPGGTQMYFVACSTGLSGDSDTAPSGATCPL